MRIYKIYASCLYAPYRFQNSPVYLIVGIGEMQLARLHETPANDKRRSKMQLTTTVG